LRDGVFDIESQTKSSYKFNPRKIDFINYSAVSVLI